MKTKRAHFRAKGICRERAALGDHADELLADVLARGGVEAIAELGFEVGHQVVNGGGVGGGVGVGGSGGGHG
ncbi:MAG: hypothetical protein U0232_30110 [Thermomicrobiales bacterium]